MRCPFCNYEESKVTDSRTLLDVNTIKRRRECLMCQNRFTTFESVDLTVQVKKKDGTYQNFDSTKLMKGLESACCHSKISHDQIRIIASKVEAEIMAMQVREIETSKIGEIVMNFLRDIDMVAYIRFACVYRRFKDIGELERAIENIKNKS